MYIICFTTGRVKGKVLWCLIRLKSTTSRSTMVSWAQVRNDWPASLSSHFTPGKEPLVFIGWVGLDWVVKRKISILAGNRNIFSGL